MKKTEVKLDQSSLPKDGQWVQCETHKHCEIVAQYDQEEQAFFPIRKNPSFIISAFEVHFWEPLNMSWSKGKKASPDPYNGTHIFEGVDAFGNKFTAKGSIGFEPGFGPLLGSLQEIEFTGNKISVSIKNQ